MIQSRLLRRIAWFAGCPSMFLLPAPLHAQRLGQGPDNDISILRVILALILCLALATAAAFVLRARMGHAPALFRSKLGSRRLELQASLRLPNQVDLSIVRCDGKELLVATSAQGLMIVKEDWQGRPEKDVAQS